MSQLSDGCFLYTALSDAKRLCLGFGVGVLGCAVHPILLGDAAAPILKRRDEAHVLTDMLLTYVSGGYYRSVAVGEGHTELLLTGKDALGVVPKDAVSGVCEVSFALIKPVVDLNVILGLTAELFDGAEGMVERVH